MLKRKFLCARVILELRYLALCLAIYVLFPELACIRYCYTYASHSVKFVKYDTHYTFRIDRSNEFERNLHHTRLRQKTQDNNVQRRN